MQQMEVQCSMTSQNMHNRLVTWYHQVRGFTRSMWKQSHESSGQVRPKRKQDRMGVSDGLCPRTVYAGLVSAVTAPKTMAKEQFEAAWM